MLNDMSGPVLGLKRHKTLCLLETPELGGVEMQSRRWGQAVMEMCTESQGNRYPLK